MHFKGFWLYLAEVAEQDDEIRSFVCSFRFDTVCADPLCFSQS